MTTQTMRMGWRAALALGLGLLLACSARAEDIDIYQGGGASGGANLLIIFDNAGASDASVTYTCTPDVPSEDEKTAGTNFGFQRCGLYKAILGIQNDPSLLGKLNVGLMYFSSGGSDGAEFVLPAQSPAPKALLPMDATGVTSMVNRIGALSLESDKGNNNKLSQSMQEAWAFYQGKQGLSGTNYPGLGSANICARNFVLYITAAVKNQKPQDGGNRGANALKAAENASGSIPQLPVPLWKSPVSGDTASAANADYKSDYADEWAAFMHTGNAAGLATPYPPIDTYTIILSDGSNVAYEQLLVNMARQGGGESMVISTKPGSGGLDLFVKALQGVFHNVQAVNGAFAAPVLPVSANTQGTYKNQIFLGVFRPDAAGKSRWVGNLKQYRFGAEENVTVDLFTADAQGNPALNPATGFFKPDAESYWTSKDTSKLPDNADSNGKGGFWLNSYQTLGAADGFDLPDGQFVEKGGAGQQARLAQLQGEGANKRKVYTCLSGSCNSGAALSDGNKAFDTGNAALTAALLGMPTGATAAQRAQLINWVRGTDTAGSASDGAAGVETNTPPTADPPITVRGSIHGDVLHSRPAVVNYGDSTGTVVFYGANDGLFRAVNGNQPGECPTGGCDIGTVPAGGELWSFVAPEFFGCLSDLYRNTKLLSLGATAPTDASCNTPKNPSGKPYFFDGTPTAYYDAEAEKWYLFLSARRGGRLLYALDITDPAAPKFLWKITGGSGDFAELGQTWSQPQAARIKGHAKPVLIFGGGYDVNQDLDPPTADDTMGRAIFVVDATNGALLWKATGGGGGTSCTTNNKVCQLKDMKYSIPADIALVPTHRDGVVDRLYAADTGGNLWRVDLEPGAEGSGAIGTWKAYQFAALGGSGTNKRKFLFAPDVVLAREYDTVAAVSGDREHPLAESSGANSVVNRFYMIRDTHRGPDGGADWEVVKDDTSGSADDKPDDLSKVTMDGEHLVEPDPTKSDIKGYYMSLTNGSGEKGVNAPTTIGGATYFGTNRPTPTSAAPEDSAEDGAPICNNANLGEARGYRVDLFTGKTFTQPFAGGGLPPSPVAGVVEVDVNGTKQSVPFVIGGPGKPSAQDGQTAQTGSPGLNRTYWSSNPDQQPDAVSD